MQKEVKLEVKNLYKIFGQQPKKAMVLLDQGLDSEAIFEKTETTVRVQIASSKFIQGKFSSSWACQVQVSRPWCGCSTG